MDGKRLRVMIEGVDDRYAILDFKRELLSIHVDGCQDWTFTFHLIDDSAIDPVNLLSTRIGTDVRDLLIAANWVRHRRHDPLGPPDIYVPGSVIYERTHRHEP